MESSSRPPVARNASLSADLGSLFAGAAVLTAWLGRDTRRARRRRGGVRARRIVALTLRLLLALLVLTAMLGAWSARWAALQLAAMWRSQSRFRAAPPAPAVAPAAVAPAAPREDEDEFARRASWIEAESQTLPEASRSLLRAMAQRMREMAQPVRELPAQASESGEFRRLLHEELPELVRAYRRVPRNLAPESAIAPEEQLCSGLAIIDAQLIDLQRRLAADELRALATQLRYLTLKYGSAAELAERPPAESPVRSAAV